MVFIDATGLRKWLDGAFHIIVESGVPKWPPWRDLQYITTRHNDGCNLSFADGHCEYWKWKDPRTIDLANLKIEPEDASENNPDLDRLHKVLQKW